VPYQLEQARKICRALGLRRQLRDTKFLVFQDNPGEGFQADIFKRFYWWEDECTNQIFTRFGLTIERRSFRELGAAALQIPDADADAVLQSRKIARGGASDQSLRSAVKLYLAVKRQIDADSSIRGAGINCLNESHFSDTTPCLAWNLLYEDQQMIWGCEADTMSMLTKSILHKSLGVPIMMTNLYPFLMGQAALKHERIPSFPDLPDAQNCVLVAHCGYLGVLPTAFSVDWKLQPKVLRIVDNNSAIIDARLPEGPITVAKLSPRLDRISVAEGKLEGYAQYPGSDCLNGAVLRFADGHKFMESISSHHYLLMTGHNRADIEMISPVFQLAVDVI
jgi:L-fucose isomerase-like protein